MNMSKDGLTLYSTVAFQVTFLARHGVGGGEDVCSRPLRIPFLSCIRSLYGGRRDIDSSTFFV